MKILVTGGAGFIASHIVDKFIELGHEVIVIDNLSTGNKTFVNPKAKFYKADIQDSAKIGEILIYEKPDVLNHHAAQISVRKSVEDPIFDAEVNIVGLLNLLEAGNKSGLKKIIFASSGGAIYGDANIIPTPEDYYPQNPLSPYGVSKLAAEKYVYFYCKNYNISYVALRYSNVYGPRQNPHGEAGVVAIFSLQLLKGESSIINGDGKQTRDYIYISDVVDANVKALENDYIGPINIGTSIETDVNKIFKLLKSNLGSNIKPTFRPPRKGEQQRSSLNIDLAQKYFNWSPKISLAKGLDLSINYFKSYST